MMKKLIAAGALAAMLTVGAAASPAMSAGTEEPTPVAAAENDRLENVTVELDPATGAIVSVRSSVETRISPVGPGCTTSSVCLNPGFGSSIYYGFKDAGTLTGSWTNRASWRTGSWTAQLKWIWNGSTVTGPTLGPGSTSNWGGSSVTVTSVRIY